MLILITYDVSTETAQGRRRLSQVAKCCVKHGQRVQHSVFECSLDYGQFIKLQDTLTKLIDTEADSLRFYNLGNSFENKVTHIGVGPSIPLAKGNIIV